MRTDQLASNTPTALPLPGQQGGVQNSQGSRTATAAAPVERVTATKGGDTTATAPVDPAELQKSVDTLNQFIQPHEGSIEFSLDDDSGKTLLKIVDKETNEVLMQIPSKEALQLSKTLGKTAGMLIKDSA